MQYLRRPAGKTRLDHRNEWRPASQFHMVSEDGQTSKCGAVTAGENNYALLDLEKPPLRSLTCHNCLTGVTIHPQ